MYLTFTDFVGFSAYATSLQTPANGDVIEFLGVVTNAGGAYNPDTSTFTCPTTAYYYIYFSLYLEIGYNGQDDCHIDITMDGGMIVEVRRRDWGSDDKHFYLVVYCSAWFVQNSESMDLM